MDKHDGKIKLLQIVVPVSECAFWKLFLELIVFRISLFWLRNSLKLSALFLARKSDGCANCRPALQLCLSEHGFLSGTWFAFRGNRPKIFSRLQESGFPLVDTHKRKKRFKLVVTVSECVV